MTQQACGGVFTTDTSVVGFCTARPCGCANALVAGCDCGFYTDRARTKAGKHYRDCKMFAERAEDER